MFTGIIETAGVVTEIQHQDPLRLVVIPEQNDFRIPVGASIAVDGCCLTVLDQDESGKLHFAVGLETSRITRLAQLAVGDIVNLERARRVDERLDGHFVLGHVDCVGTVTNAEFRSDMLFLRVRVPEGFIASLIYKGSVALNGVSLTINNLDRHGFEVALLPYTLAATNLAECREGYSVHVEFDVMGKYILRYLETHPRTVADLSALLYQREVSLA